ncbi:hypothetical protein LY78DRAFT_709556 [Colletotrichum sublineola]|nr:hypothetical protein LY78DRAFT_709556 [Colletotrichum sublineola]
MRFSLLFVLGPVAVLSDFLSSGLPPKTGQLCCSREGVADPSGTCKKAGLNSFACESIRGNARDHFLTILTIKRDAIMAPWNYFQLDAMSSLLFRVNRVW